MKAGAKWPMNMGVGQPAEGANRKAA
jgi:hypothetical protein